MTWLQIGLVSCAVIGACGLYLHFTSSILRAGACKWQRNVLESVNSKVHFMTEQEVEASYQMCLMHADIEERVGYHLIRAGLAGTMVLLPLNLLTY